MNCPSCGRFMELDFARELDRDVKMAVFWWTCNNDSECPVADWRQHIPAPEYDWLYWCRDIPESDLDADPEMRTECEGMHRRYSNRPAARKKVKR